MSDINPYAPPPLLATEVPPVNASFAERDGLWRNGNGLVMLKEAQLPARCVKSNQPTDQRLQRKLVWYPPWIAFTILIAWPIFLVLVLVLQKKATIQIGLTPAWLARRKRRLLIAWGIAALAAVMFIGGMAMIEDGGAILVFLALFTAIGAGIYGQYATRMVYPTKIDDRFVYLSGVCPAYLADLPQWVEPRR